jgi:hypothetical protein
MPCFAESLAAPVALRTALWPTLGTLAAATEEFLEEIVKRRALGQVRSRRALVVHGLGGGDIDHGVADIGGQIRKGIRPLGEGGRAYGGREGRQGRKTQQQGEREAGQAPGGGARSEDGNGVKAHEMLS